MEILPVLKSFRRNKVGAVLIVLQIAITLAVMSNCLAIIRDNLAHMRRPTGVDEANIFILGNQWVGNPADLGPRIQADLAAIRSVPGIVDAQATNSYPLHGGGLSGGLFVQRGQTDPTASTAMYFVDEHGNGTYGLKLTAGRGFTPDEIGEQRIHDIEFPASVVVTAALAHRLYRSGSALGQVVYWPAGASSRIVGIVEQAQAPWAAWTEARAEYSAFLPYHYINNPVTYVVRARPGKIGGAMPAVQARLLKLTRQRVLEAVTFEEVRANAYFAPRSTGVLLGVLCAVLLAVTVFGIVGLTTYWVGQRRRYIGMRRALGARRIDILGYLHTENLLIAGSGVLLGILLGLGGNLWLTSHLQLPRMSAAYISVGAVIVMAISQAAVFFPAMRAASIAPTEAIRAL
jgi:putative ABC transport system permease protein